MAYGGAGGQHACRLAVELGLASVLLHHMAGVLSAYGMGQARQRRRLQLHLGVPLTPTLLRQLPERVQLLRRQARQHLREQGDLAAGAADDLDPWISLELRSGGAEQTVVLTWTPELSVDGLVDAFHASHQHRFGYRCEADQCLVVEMLSLELAAPRQHNASASSLEPLSTSATPTSTDSPRIAGGPAQQVRLHLPGRGWCAVPLFQRSQLALGEGIHGPALIVETTGCTVLEPGWSARVAAAGELVLEREQGVSRPVAPASCSDQQDPVQAELFRHRFMAIAEQMGEQLRQSSRSVNIRERLDFSCALFDAAGTLVANAPHIPVHLGSMGDSVRDLVGQVDLGAVPSLQPGDTLLSNDPFHGGTHLPDITAITPVFCGGSAPSFFVASRGHHADVGGISPGSMPSFSHRIDEEGLLLRNLLFVRDGRINHGLWEQVCAGIATPPRNPVELLADLQAQVAANQAGVNALQRLVDREGQVVVQRQMNALQSHAARCVERLLERLDDGDYQLPLDDGSVLVVAIRLDRGRQRLVLDFTGTSDQRAGNFNAPLAVTRSVVLYVIRCLLEDDIPLNEGCFTPLELVVPLGSMLNPRPPAAVVAGNVEVSQALCNLLFGAFGVLAAGQGTMNNLSFGDGERQYYETVAGGGGAGVGFNGSVALQTHMTNSRLTDPEVLETRYPVRLERFAIRAGSGGDGQWRGGDGLERTIRFLEPMTVSVISGSRRVPPFGLHGGKSGACGVNLRLGIDGAEQRLAGAVQLELNAGEAIQLLTPGGGGMGASRLSDGECV